MGKSWSVIVPFGTHQKFENVVLFLDLVQEFRKGVNWSISCIINIGSWDGSWIA